MLKDPGNSCTEINWIYSGKLSILLYDGLTIALSPTFLPEQGSEGKETSPLISILSVGNPPESTETTEED